MQATTQELKYILSQLERLINKRYQDDKDFPGSDFANEANKAVELLKEEIESEDL